MYYGCPGTAMSKPRKKMGEMRVKLWENFREEEARPWLICNMEMNGGPAMS
jgi:hypothetical protein